MAKRRRSPRVYVASSVLLYERPEYVAYVELARALRPNAELVPAHGLYRDAGHWLVTWPRHLPTLGELLLAPMPDDRSIGRGAWIEHRDAQAAGLPTATLCLDCGGEHPVDFEGEIIGHHRGGGYVRWVQLAACPLRSKAA